MGLEFCLLQIQSRQLELSQADLGTLVHQPVQSCIEVLSILLPAGPPRIYLVPDSAVIEIDHDHGISTMVGLNSVIAFPLCMPTSTPVGRWPHHHRDT